MKMERRMLQDVGHKTIIYYHNVFGYPTQVFMDVENSNFRRNARYFTVINSSKGPFIKYNNTMWYLYKYPEY